MKRKLIDYDVFEQMERDSLSRAENELVAAEPILARALQVEGLTLRHFGPQAALYEAADGSYVHTSYGMQDKHITFDNIEQLVINEDTERVAARELLSDMLDSLLEEKEKEAEHKLDEYLSMPFVRRTFNEVKKLRVAPERDSEGNIKGYKKVRWQTTPKKRERSDKTIARMRGKKVAGRKRSKSAKKNLGAKRQRIRKTLPEWANLSSNVLDYVDIKINGPTIKESVVRHDEEGGVTAVRIPNTELRNENELKSFNWKTLEANSKVLRNNGKTVAEDIDFCKAVADLKRHNALSDNDALVEAIESIVGRWPNVLFLTRRELASSIKEALETVGATNYDDQTCDFMAEGILRVAHEAYVDRVGKVMKMAGAEPCEDCDQYEQFEQVVSQFYPSLDESDMLEMQVFVDLYEAIREVHVLAGEAGNEELQVEAASYLDDLAAVIKQDEEPTLELAADAAEWLEVLVETNLESQGWNISNTPHITVTGDHPRMAQNARHSYAPAGDFSGNFNDPAPVSQGDWSMGKGSGDAQEMRNRSWGNEAGSDTYPSLQNPYVPKPFGTYTMKGEKGVDKANDATGQWGSGDTWPELQNPYVPKAETPQSYKMNHGKEADLVVDK